MMDTGYKLESFAKKYYKQPNFRNFYKFEFWKFEILENF